MSNPGTTTHTLEVFRPGTHVTMGGEAIAFSADDLRALASAYDASGAPAPIVVGHPTADAPAYGWATGFRYDDATGRLVAEVGDVVPAFAEAVRAKRYRKVSLSFFRPDEAANPAPGNWYPRHIGFLGAAAPAVTGLKMASFTAGDPVTVEFSAAGRASSGLFRRIRDFIIDKYSLDDADRVLPDYELRWLDEAAAEPTPAPEPAATLPAFTAPPTPEEPSMSNPTPTPSAPVAQPVDFAARDAELAARELRISEAERGIVHGGNVAFAAELVAAGRLPAVQEPRLVTVLDAIAGPSPAAPVAFAAGETATSPVEHLKALLRQLPLVIPMGGILPDERAADAPSFAAPDGRRDVDGDRLNIHARAVAWQAAHPGTDYMAAVRAVDPNA